MTAISVAPLLADVTARSWLLHAKLSCLQQMLRRTHAMQLASHVPASDLRCRLSSTSIYSSVIAQIIRTTISTCPPCTSLCALPHTVHSARRGDGERPERERVVGTHMGAQQCECMTVDTSTCRCQEARMTGQCQGDPPEWRSAPDPGLCGVCDTVSCTRTVLCSHVCSHVCSHRERARAAARQYASTSASVHSIGETTSRGCAARSGKPCFGANGGGALCWANKLLIP